MCAADWLGPRPMPKRCLSIAPMFQPQAISALTVPVKGVCPMNWRVVDVWTVGARAPGTPTTVPYAVTFDWYWNGAVDGVAPLVMTATPVPADESPRAVMGF